jgi:hypothetical protein
MAASGRSEAVNMELTGRRNAATRVEQAWVGSSEQASHKAKAKARNLRAVWRRSDRDPAVMRAPLFPSQYRLQSPLLEAA